MRRVLARFPGRRSSLGVIVAWGVLAVVFAPFGAKVPDITNDEYILPGSSQTAQLHDVLKERFPGGDLRMAVIAYRREGGFTPADRSKILADARAIRDLESVAEPTPPFAAGSPPGLVDPSGEVAFTVVPLEAGEVFHVTPTIEAIRERVAGGGPLDVHVTGWPSLVADFNSAVKEADFKLLGATIVLVLVLLIAVYRSPILAVVPLLVVGIAYSIANGVVYLLNRGFGLPVDSSSTSLLLVLMFGAGTDYCLLLVSRYGAKLRRTASAADALRSSIPEAAPPMIASAVTVIAALLAALAGVFGVYRTLGPINAIGIAIVLLASLTLLPAILSLLGRRAYWPSAAAVAPSGAGAAEENGRWRTVGIAVRRRPALYLGLSLAFLLASSSGLLFWKTDLDPITGFRSPTDSTRGYEILSDAFPPGLIAPTSVLVDRTAGPLRPEDVAAISERVRTVPGVQTVVDTGRRAADGRAALLNAIYEDSPFRDPALERTQEVRDAVAGAVPGVRVLVGEGSGERLDASRAQSRDTKVIVPIVLLLVLATLIVLLRAVVAPLYLLATVMLSFTATLGLTIIVFKFLFGRDGFNSAMPLIVFIFLVALGSDYNIFLMSRVREEAARFRTREGTLNALAATGPVITSAGVILAGTFVVLTIVPSWDLTLVGFAVALGVLMDTFLVRSICVPAITWLVGERSWWPSSAEAGDKATVVSGVFTTQELLGVKRDG